MPKSPRFSVTFDQDTYEQIIRIAMQDKKSQAEVVRDLTQIALTPRVLEQNIDLICTVIRTQLKDIMAPYMERNIALSAKACIQSGTAAYLNAETIARFLPEDLQQDVQEVYEAARKKAVSYTRQPEEYK